MADSKWISDLAGEMPLAVAARRVLQVRLEAVAERLPDALFRSDEDLEHVHQLRVSTRRAGAAVRIFQACLPAKTHKEIRKTLKKVRRAAGEARDWDVFVAALAARRKRAPREQQPGLDFLLGYGQSERSLAQCHLTELEELANGEYATVVRTVIADVSEPAAEETFRQQAIPLLSALLGELDAAATQDLENYEHLHAIRILGKQLRYAMEVFAACFAPEFREKLYPAVEDMQDILGLANDSFVAGQRLTAIRDRLERTQKAAWPKYRPGLEALLRYHQQRLPSQRRKFIKWWQSWQSSGLEERLEKMLH
jgi:CHAD domain-containing protein